MRWWDGAQWTPRTSGQPRGWYPDPWNAAPFRWWDGVQWTPHTSMPPGRVSVAEPAPTFPFAAAWWVVAGIAASVVGSAVVTSVAVDHLRVPAAAAVALFYTPLFAGILATCIAISRRFGTGSLVADFQWRARVGDLLRGPPIAIAALVASGIANSPWVHDDDIARTDRALGNAYAHLPSLALVEIAVAALVLAPLIEELAFRGVLLRSLSERIAVGWAITIQAVLFGLYHFSPELGRANEPGVVVRAASGVVLGLAATRWRRLGPGMVAHFAVNALIVGIFVAAH